MRLDYNSPEALAPVIEALLFASDEPLSALALRSLILGEEQVKTDVNEEQASEGADVQNPEELADAITPDGQEGAENGQASDEQIIEEQAESTKKPKQQRKKKQLIELTTIHDAVKLLNGQLEETTRPYRIVEIAGGYQFATRADYAEYVARLFKEKSRRRLSGASLETLAIIAYKQPVSKQDIENIRGVNCDEVLKSLLEKNLVTITGRAEAVGRPLLYGTTTDFLRHFGLHSISDLPKPREIEELMKEEAVKATTLDEAAREFVDPSVSGEEGVALDEIIAEAKEVEGTNENDTGEESTGKEGIGEAENDISNGIELDIDAMTSSGETVEFDEGHELADDDELDDEETEEIENLDGDDLDENDLDEDDLDENEIEELDDEDLDEDELEELGDEEFDEDAEEVLEDENGKA